MLRFPLILEHHPKPSRWNRLKRQINNRLTYAPRPSRETWRQVIFGGLTGYRAGVPNVFFLPTLGELKCRI